MADFGVTEDGHPDEVVLPGSHNVATRPTTGPQTFQRGDPGRPSMDTTSSSSRPMQPPSRAPMARSSSSGQQQKPQPQTPQAASRPGPQPAGKANGPTLAQVSVAQAAGNGQTSTPPPAAGFEQIPEGPVAFFSARSVKVLSEAAPPGSQTLPLGGGKLFDPKLDSPSIRKTPGIDHSSTKPVGKDKRHVEPIKKDEEQAPRPGGGFGAASGPGRPSMSNVVNLSLNHARQIGAPGSHSPMGNRGAYKPPTITKRPADGGARPPLNEVTTNGTVGAGTAGADAKRQKVG